MECACQHGLFGSGPLLFEVLEIGLTIPVGHSIVMKKSWHFWCRLPLKYSRCFGRKADVHPLWSAQ